MVAGALVPALLGSLIYFNVLFVEADQEGAGGAAITHQAEWQPFLRHLDLVPVGVRDVFDANTPEENDRGEYVVDPYTHYGYIGWDARLDFWWLWIEPMGSHPALYIFFVPVAMAGVLSVLVASGRLTRGAPRANPASDDLRRPDSADQ